MKKILIILLTLSGCIGEDIVFDEVSSEIRLTNPLVSLEISTSYQFEYMLLNNVGEEVIPDELIWQSSDESILTIDADGLALAVDYGSVIITFTAMLGESITASTFEFEITDETVITRTERFGVLKSTSSYTLEGDFDLSEEGDNLLLTFESNYVADTGLPGLYVYLSNNPNSITNAYEIGVVTKFSGAHSYTISGVDLYDYSYVLYFCKPFNVRVGDGEIKDN